ncbi:coupling factor for flagellin transcription and translation [Bacillus freudenreichii]|nr:coupling factor for flagellin transcription and translation [Bacillus freudenreichii]
MTGSLISVLFLMNVLFAFSLILLYMRQNRLLEIEKRQKLLLEESEQVMSALLEEIKEENERLLRTMNESREEAITKGKLFPEALMEELEHEQIGEPLKILKNMDQADLSGASVAEDLKGSESALESLPLKEQVDLLASQGLSVTQIAKKLHKGKTEIELLMKFQ